MESALSMIMSPDLARKTVGEEAALVSSSLNGNQEDFAELVRRHQNRVFRLVGRFFMRREDVEDLAQETFLTAWRKLHTYGFKAPFEHWLTRVCLNCCYARLRKNRPEEEPLPADPTAASATSPEASLELQRTMRALSPEERFILLLLHGEGWSVAEIAERLGWTRVNVKVRAHRARRKLRRLLEAS
jgi:RNA polymerase sigma-70 factor (ECF subfamily)